MVDSQPGSAVEVLANAPIRPVDISERITAIDTLRGFALLGILLMNVVSMGMYGHAYDNPTVTGGATGANLWIWTVMHVLAEGKMRCLFSLVFGASVVLLLSRMESRKEAADIYYRRTYWMMAFGIVHAYLLWEGEILYPYAVCGLLLYTFRNLRPRRLIAIGLVLLAAEAGFSIRGAFERKDKMEKGQAAVRAAAQNRKLTEEEEEAKRDYEKFQKEEHPDAAFLKKLNDQWRGNPWQVIQARAKDVYPWHATPYFHWWNFDMWSMMFIGMGLLKLGVFSGERPARFYWGLHPDRLRDRGSAEQRHGVAADPQRFRPGDAELDGDGLRRGSPVGGAGTPGRDHAAVPEGLDAVADREAGSDRADGAEQLRVPVGGDCVYLHGLRVQAVREVGAVSTVLCGGGNLGGAVDRVADLGTALPLRPDGVVLAVADLLEEAADAAGRERRDPCGESVWRELNRVSV